MTTAQPAWKKFLKLKSDVPVATANIADAPTTKSLKRKREALPPQKPQKSILKRATTSPQDIAERKVKANKQKKKAKTKTKRSKKDEAESKAAQSAALEYLSLYCSARKEWKFSKPRQNYLIKHTYDDDLISEAHFPNLLKYLQGLQGASKDRCLTTAQSLVSRHATQQGETTGDTEPEEGTGGPTKSSKEDDDETAVEDVTDDQAERARRIEKALMDADPPGEEDDAGDK